MTRKQTVVYTARTMQEAYLLKDVLAEAGIEAIVTNEVLEGGAGVDVVGWVTLARVVVAEEDAETARRIARYFDGAKDSLPDDLTDDLTEEGAAEGDRSMFSANDGPKNASIGRKMDQPPTGRERLENPEAAFAAWPQCPECDSPRPTRCPICGTIGSDFPQADPQFVGTPDSDEPAEPKPPGLVLMCPTCDEPFVPEFPRRCAWCDHQFDDGFDVDQFDDQPPEEIGSRVLAVVFFLMVLLLAVAAYFVSLV